LKNRVQTFISPNDVIPVALLPRNKSWSYLPHLSGATTLKAPNDPADRSPGIADDEVDVIRHQTECKNRMVIVQTPNFITHYLGEI